MPKVPSEGIRPRGHKENKTILIFYDYEYSC